MEDIAGMIESSQSEPGLSAAKGKQKAKLLSFCENRRPAYWGTWSKDSRTVCARTPFAKDVRVVQQNLRLQHQHVSFIIGNCGILTYWLIVLQTESIMLIYISFFWHSHNTGQVLVFIIAKQAAPFTLCLLGILQSGHTTVFLNCFWILFHYSSYFCILLVVNSDL